MACQTLEMTSRSPQTKIAYGFSNRRVGSPPQFVLVFLVCLFVLLAQHICQLQCTRYTEGVIMVDFLFPWLLGFAGFGGFEYGTGVIDCVGIINGWYWTWGCNVRD